MVKRLFQQYTAAACQWSTRQLGSSESGHPFLFQDDDGQDYLFYQGNHNNGKTWHLSVLPIDWKNGRPVVAPEKLPGQ